MNKEEYQNLVNEVTPKPKKLLDAFKAFITGGFIGLFGQVVVKFLQMTFDLSVENATVWMLLIVIFIASLFTVLHFFDDFVVFCKAGLIVPITGFAHSITSAILDYKKDGLVTGIGANVFKLAGCVLLYGVVSGFTLALLKVIING